MLRGALMLQYQRLFLRRGWLNCLLWWNCLQIEIMSILMFAMCLILPLQITQNISTCGLIVE